MAATRAARGLSSRNISNAQVQGLKIMSYELSPGRANPQYCAQGPSSHKLAAPHRLT